MEAGLNRENAPRAPDAAAGRSWTREWVALILGLAAAVAVLSPPVDDIVDRSFSAHMLQHMVLTMSVAPLLAYAVPLVLRHWKSARVVTALSVLTRPFVALVVSTVGIWMWHFPRLYDAALENDRLHALEHLVFILAFIIFWRPLMNNGWGPGRLRSNEARVLYLTVGMFTTGLLAAYITFAKHLIYTHYAALQPGARSPIADQQLGGAYMLIVGTIAILAAVVLTLRDDPN